MRSLQRTTAGAPCLHFGLSGPPPLREIDNQSYSLKPLKMGLKPTSDPFCLPIDKDGRIDQSAERRVASSGVLAAA